MPLYVTSHDTARVETSYERSPVIALVTEGASELEVPAELRAASDRLVIGGMSLLKGCSIAKDIDGAILWLNGDQLLESSAAVLRKEVLDAGGRAFVPIHLPCLLEFDLVGLQPRIWTSGRSPDRVTDALRLAGAVSPSVEFSSLLAESVEPWAIIYRALLVAHEDAQQGWIELFRLWREAVVLAPVFRALLLSNLIVVAIRHGELERAGKLASLAMDYFPRSAWLAFLGAWLAMKQDNLPAARRLAQQAIESGNPSFVGCGGERSYRSQWLLGLTYELEGKQAPAIGYYWSGALRYPAFPPSVLGLLRQRLSFSEATLVATNLLTGLVRREPQYLEAVFHFLLVHRQFEPARSLLRRQLSDELRQKLESALEESAGAFKPMPRQTGSAPGVMLTGALCVNSSLARINRELAAALTAHDEFEVALEPFGSAEMPVNALPGFEAILKGLKHRLSRLDLTIRHHWPPNFGPAPSGKLVCIFPWEYGAIPRRWAEQIERNVAEMWVPSRFVRDVLCGAGVDPAKIRVIPNGIDPETFTPEGPAWRPEGCRSFAFLFVGGAIARKGLDILWNAYARAFSAGDDVTLIVKEMGSATFYAGMSLVGSLRAAASQPGAPRLITLSDDVDDRKLAALYRGCGALVLPYRGEGFGLPLAEALACGKPVITTELGPAPEFCPPEASYFIRARIAEFANPRSTLGPMTGPNTWFDPDVNDLARVMRHVYERREEAALKGKIGAEKVRPSLAWGRVRSMQLERIRQLTQHT